MKDPIPIVSLTADAQAQAMDDCLEAGMQRLFTKPLRQGLPPCALSRRDRLINSIDDMLELIRTFILQAPNL
jgi:CheY-like chemotaxis protein